MQPAHPPASGDTASVLLVDDRPQNLVALEAMLSTPAAPWGGQLTLVAATSGEEALRYLLKDDFAVILLDVLMPGMNGLETAALIRARERSRDTPIIFLTADLQNDDLMTRGYALGAVDFIVKPIHPHVLRSKVAVFVELFRKAEQVRHQAAQLAALNEELEARVAARTIELERTVKKLKHQMAERKRAEAERAHLLVRERAARQEAEQAQQRAAFLAEASLLLDASLDYTATLSDLARRIVPEMADLCAIDVMEDESHIQHIADAAGPAREELWRDLHRLYPPAMATDAHPVKTVLRSGEPLVMPAVSDALLNEVAGAPEHLRIVRELAPVSYMVMPLRAHGRTLGAMTCAMAESGRTYGSADVALADEVARRAAQAVDNALLYRQAREAIRIREDFLSVASHELKTPITSLHVAVQTIGRAAQHGLLGDPPPERVQRMLDVIELQDQRLIKLVNDLLDVSRIGEGRLRLDLEEVDLTAIVQDVVERFREEIALAECQLDLQAEDRVVGRWDRSRLEQVVTNLLTNALKYGAGRPVTISVSADATSGRLVVTDQGIGIARQHVERIFGRFERAVSANDYTGVGLGLYIVREIVAALGGTIGVVSEPGSGATFTVALPLQVPSPSAPAASPAAPEHATRT